MVGRPLPVVTAHGTRKQAQWHTNCLRRVVNARKSCELKTVEFRVPRRKMSPVEEVRFTILASGSSGNAAYLETPGARLLLDCGISARRIREGLLAQDRTPERLDGIFITHEHSDHVQGLRVLAQKARLPIYCNRHTAEEIRRIHKCDFEFRLFETGHTVEIGDLTVETFPVPHDAIDPVGFLLHTPAAHIGFLTDLGQGTRLIADRIRPAEVLVLETNHDVDLLWFSAGVLTSSLPARIPPWTPSAFENDPTSNVTLPWRPKWETIPRPSPKTPSPCQSSTNVIAPCSSARSAISSSGAMSPSMLKTPSVIISLRSESS